ncbi:DUF4238 domain-containing protein [Dokdonella immobilis]|uniref:DUF4238 domain-containing protein n=1 Tax=Dokdonella immobilis TaxID=578942 RepID=A0A1I4W1M6_9GAMM|nr:DUF4238 domain-containing protein [Dokdonella immobilis]SFN07464.1 Protein of unknown function [Dokdonella immobilis]
MAAYDNQHYVPVRYFALFKPQSRTICLVLRKNGKFIPNASISGQSSSHRFYGSDALEAAITGFESACGDLLEEFAAMDDLGSMNSKQFYSLLRWIGFQRARTEAARSMDRPMWETMYRVLGEHAIVEGRPALERPPDRDSQLAGMMDSLEHSRFLSRLTPYLLSNRTNRPLIFGDAPVVYFNSAFRHVVDRGVLGTQSPGLQIFAPIGNNKAIALFDPDYYRVRSSSDGEVRIRDLHDVAALNALQIHSAAHAVYFSDTEFAPYVRDLWEQQRGRLRTHSATILSYMESVGEDQEREVNVFFEPVVPYDLNLSFVSRQRR